MRTAEYLPAVVAVLVSAAVGAAASLFAGRLGPKKRAAPQSAHGQPFEGGSEVIGQAHAPLALRLYPMLLAFLVFDVAVALLLPWALLVGQLASLPAEVCTVASPCVSKSQLLGTGATFGVVLVIAWLHVRGTRAAKWNA
jgi:NADH-quinone oxidoreductase subunit A